MSTNSADHQLARTGVPPEEPQAVRAPEQPQLGPVERGEEPEHERLPRRAVEVALDRDQHERGHQPLGVAERGVGHEAAVERQRHRRDQTAEHRRGEHRRVGLAGDRADEPDARRNTIATAITAPARATTSHRSGAALPNRAKIVVKITVSGFQVGPPVVWSFRWTISRPHTSHDHGS